MIIVPEPLNKEKKKRRLALSLKCALLFFPCSMEFYGSEEQRERKVYTHVYIYIYIYTRVKRKLTGRKGKVNKCLRKR